jgi:hypothetical protein
LNFFERCLIESNLQFAAFSGGALAESRLALLQYKREQPKKV